MKRQHLLAPPSDLEIEAGARGELLIARIRLWVLLIFVPIPLLSTIERPHWENRVGLGVIVVGLVAALLIHRAVQRDPSRGWIGVLSVSVDISLITMGLSIFLLFGQPITATNSLVLFGAYYIAIMATALRHDPRLSMLAGVLAVGQYGLMVLVATTSYDLLTQGLVSQYYGSFSWGTQIARMLLLTTAAALATIIVLRQGELLHRSSVDALTMLYNRGTFTERLGTETTRSRRHGHPLSVAMIDIDHFKRINDDYGHTAGDAALTQFAAVLKAEFRQTDLVARHGGEEFVVMMPETAPDGATLKLERVVRNIARRQFTISRRGGAVQLTVSAGVAGVPGDTEDPERLLEIADARLISAKRAGRNQVVGSGAPLPELA